MLGYPLPTLTGSFIETEPEDRKSHATKMEEEEQDAEEKAAKQPKEGDEEVAEEELEGEEEEVGEEGAADATDAEAAAAGEGGETAGVRENYLVALRKVYQTVEKKIINIFVIVFRSASGSTDDGWTKAQVAKSV